MNKLSDCYKMQNSVEIPCVGFGTWKALKKDAVDSVKCAIETGYRHIDTASAYENEQFVGSAIKESGIKREDLFVTTKLWNADQGYDTTIAAFKKSLSKLGLSYIDLYLIHWPIPKAHKHDWKDVIPPTWKAFEKLYEDGLIRSIGVSNFLPHHMDHLLKTAKVVPMVNQIEFHPGYMQKQAVEYCKDKGIIVEAWSPMGGGDMFKVAFLKDMAQKYGCDIAGLCIRWCLQHDVLPLPKSVTPARIKSNADVFNFEISKEDMNLIDAMPNCGDSGLYPDDFIF